MYHRGKNADGVNMFEAKAYMRVLNGRTCRGETETFLPGDMLMYLLDASDKKQRMYETAAGKLLERLTRYKYIKALAFWVDVRRARARYAVEGTKLFQRNQVMLSDVTQGVEGSISSISDLKTTPGDFMQGLSSDFDEKNQTLFNTELTNVKERQEEYLTMLSTT